MEIRNNLTSSQPNFGMAFLKPDPKDMKSFADYVTKGKKAKYVGTALKQFRAKHANDIHYDLRYSKYGDAIVIEPKTEKAKSMFVSSAESFKSMANTAVPTSFELTEAKMQKELNKLGKDQKFKQMFVNLKGFCNFIKDVFRFSFVDKTDILPANMRLASKIVKEREAQIAKEIAKEAVITKAFE